jgi:hypothetical protein
MLMRISRAESELPNAVATVLTDFVRWLDTFGETSLDHQTFFSGRVGGAAKALYYRRPALGAAAVAPIIACEAFFPAARRFFDRPTRFPIADAHYAMGFAFLHAATGRPEYLRKATHFAGELKKSRCADFQDYCWGYPFDWVTRNGTIRKQTPLITSTPYAYEAFLQLFLLDPRDEWKQVLQSIARQHQGLPDLGRRQQLLVYPVRLRRRDQCRGVQGLSADERLQGAQRRRLPDDREPQSAVRPGQPERERVLVLRRRRRARLRRPLPHLLRDEGAGEDPQSDR